MRWSSTYSMLKHYKELQDLISKLDEVEIDELVPSKADSRRIKGVMNELFKLQSVAWKLHENNVSMADVRGLFDCAIDEFQVTSSRLPMTASIIQSPTFELGVVKIQLGSSAALLCEEREFVKTF